MSLADLPPITKAAPKKGGLTFFRQAAKAQAKANMANVKKLMKLIETSGKSVSGVAIGPDGAVSVTTSDAAKPAVAFENPWDAELC